ncbi:MAG: DUF6446 family protein [Pseudomonadota bacterium]
MKGRTFLIGFVAVLAVFTGVLWWTQTRAFYTEVTGLTSVTVASSDVAVTGYRGIDATSSPIKLRACFGIDPADLSKATQAENPTPLIAPSWFDCFDAGALTRALEAGEATAYLAAKEEHDGVDRLIAVYSDGRAFMWRQLNEKYAE